MGGKLNWVQRRLGQAALRFMLVPVLGALCRQVPQLGTPARGHSAHTAPMASHYSAPITPWERGPSSAPVNPDGAPAQGSQRARGQLGQREQQHSDGDEVAGVGRELSAAGQSRGTSCSLLSPLWVPSWCLVCVRCWGPPCGGACGVAGPSPPFTAAQIHQCFHLIALCL